MRTFDALTIEHNGILAAAGREAAVFDAALAWFAGLRDEADELHFQTARYWRRARRKPSKAVAWGRVEETVMPSYSVDLSQLSASGELEPGCLAPMRARAAPARPFFDNSSAPGPACS